MVNLICRNNKEYFKVTNFTEISKDLFTWVTNPSEATPFTKEKAEWLMETFYITFQNCEIAEFDLNNLITPTILQAPKP